MIDKENASEDQLMNLVLESGAEDLKDSGDSWEIISDPNSHEAVLTAVQAAKIETISAEVAMVPKNLMTLMTGCSIFGCTAAVSGLIALPLSLMSWGWTITICVTISPNVVASLTTRNGCRN